MNAKTFGTPTDSLAQLEEAVATYTARAAEKLRRQDSLATYVNVFVRTNPFQQDLPQLSAPVHFRAGLCVFCFNG
jgi:DNA polymerase V